jgi:hypothetical protein
VLHEDVPKDIEKCCRLFVKKKVSMVFTRIAQNANPACMAVGKK